MPEQGLAQPAPADTFSPQLTPSQISVGQLPGYQSRADGLHPGGGTVTAPRTSSDRPDRSQLSADPLHEGGRPGLPALGLDGFSDGNFGSEGNFGPGSWLDGPMESMVDHPLLRGLLLELPPRGTQPSPEWMNRWFEATRSVLDLIYLRK